MRVHARYLLLLVEMVTLVVLAAYLGHHAALVMTSPHLTHHAPSPSPLLHLYHNHTTRHHSHVTPHHHSETSQSASEGTITTLNSRRLTSPPPTFIPYQPDTSPLGRPPDIPRRFLIEEADFCQRRPGLQIIAYVHSAISRVKQRNITRTTWANASAYDMGPISVNIGVVFMVGRPKDEQEQRIVNEESQRYHDIVQGDYGEHYRLLTYKALASLYWITRHCPHVPWTLHSDDDTYIDIFLFNQYLQNLGEAGKKNFQCSTLRWRSVLRSGRWKVSYAEYPGNRYPLYCSGAVWFLQTRLIWKLLKAIKSVPYLWVDDTYITGLVAKKARIGHVRLNKQFGRWRRQPEMIGKRLAWFEMLIPRTVWWQRILEYHSKRTLHSNHTFRHNHKYFLRSKNRHSKRTLHSNHTFRHNHKYFLRSKNRHNHQYHNHTFNKKRTNAS